MKIVLTADVKGIGTAGKVVEVAQGYARNYLFPKKLAVPATEHTVKEIEENSRKKAAKALEGEMAARRQADRLSGETLIMSARAGEAGKLFGSVTNKELAEAIKTQYGLEVDRRKIGLEAPIKAVGVYNVTLRLHPQVHVELQVKVSAG